MSYHCIKLELLFFKSLCHGVVSDIISINHLQFTVKATKCALLGCVVSGLCSLKVLACSLMIKEFCGGKARWNDRAIFIETDLKPCILIRRGRFLTFSNLWKKQCQNASPSALSELLYPSILGILQVAATPFLPMQGFLESLFQYTPTSFNWSLW